MMISTGRSTLDDDLDDVQILDDEESDVDPTADTEEEGEEENAEDDPGLPVDSAAELLDLFDDPDEVDDDL